MFLGFGILGVRGLVDIYVIQALIKMFSGFNYVDK